MRLVKAYINGFRKFEKATVDLDSDLVAIVGPNEAGKSSLLAALMATRNNDDFRPTDFTRSPSQSEVKTSIKLLYALGSEERELAKKFGGTGQPRWYYVKKDETGVLSHWVEPEVKRDLTYREKASDRIQSILKSSRLDKPLSKEFELPQSNEQEPPGKTTLRVVLEAIQTGIDTDSKNIPENVLNDTDVALKLLQSVQSNAPSTSRRTWEITGEILNRLSEYEKQPHPKDKLLEELENCCPDFLLFDDEARSLVGEYPFQSLADPPAALRNILGLAALKATELKQAIETNNYGERERLIEQANDKLRERFERAWKQSPIFVRLQIDSDVLRILVSGPKTYSGFAERSDGLKSFVALYAYASLHTNGPPPILLIDEADSHLHYDAQADLIRVFETQEIADKIIYTTHSAGCLPNDLGTGIRVVKPIHEKNKQDVGKSDISNSFWTEGAGFSPLMIAMGASVMALVPARKAIIAEGPSDVLLLPTLFREALKLERLDFQVAPGLASVSIEQAKQLSLEAPAVAYILDGDEGGKNHRAKLKAAGVSDDLIFDYGSNVVIEDFIDIDVYICALNEELRRSHGTQVQISKGDVSDDLRPSSVKSWSKENNIAEPNKVKVASHVLNLRSKQSILNHRKQKRLTELYRKITKALNPD